jgi:PleD family two-component response regulator
MSVLEIINIWMTQYGFCDVDGLKTIEDINEQAQVIFPLFEFDFKTEADYIEFLEKARAKQADLSYEMINNTIMQKHDIEVLRKEVGQDSMTHLYNHERFWELLKHEIGRAERYDTDLSVIMCDIDDFKAINDSFGHLAGDRVIKVIANRLKVLLRGSDLIARYGGEERLRKKIAAFKLKVGKQIITLTMSIGIASRQKNDRISVDDFIRLADDALYKAKSEGKNRCKVA